MPSTIEDLRSVYRSLSESDQATAASLGQGYHRYGSWTEKQQRLVDMLVDRARKPQGGIAQVTPRETRHYDLTGLNEMFDRAAAKQKFPKLVLQLGNTALKLYRAGPQSKTPGAINVVERLRHEHGNGAYYGKVLTDGRWIPARDVIAPAGLLEFLDELATDPAGVASNYGQSTGECCFCARELTDERSVRVGYGPVCADRFGLPWGE